MPRKKEKLIDVINKPARHRLTDHSIGLFGTFVPPTNITIRHTPEEPEGLMSRGITEYNDQKYSKALQSFSEAIKQQSQNAKAYTYLAIVLSALNRQDQAALACKSAIEIDQDLALAHHVMGDTFFHSQRYEEALESYLTAIDLDGNFPQSYCNIGNTLRQLGHYAAAAKYLERATLLKPGYGEALQLHGSVLNSSGRYEEAVSAFTKAHGSQPNNPDHLLNLAGALISISRKEEANRRLRDSLELAPENVESLYLLAVNGALSINSPECQSIERLLDAEYTLPGDKISLSFAYGHILDGAQHYDDAFKQFRNGNELQNTSSPYVHEDAVQEVERIKGVFTKEFFRDRRGWGDQSDIPVFILGLPRSGKSTLESVLASSPNVHTAGERLEPFTLAYNLPDWFGLGGEFPETAQELTAELTKEGAAEYLAEMLNPAPSARHVTEGMSANAVIIGLLALFFPRATILYCQRNPVDTGLECYMRRFSKAHAYSNDFSQFAQYFQLYQGLMDHWRDVLPNPVIDVQFNDFTSKPDETRQRLNAILNIDISQMAIEKIQNRGNPEHTRHYDAYVGALRNALG